MSEARSTVEGWAILELMGHQRMAGYVRETTIAGAGMLEVRVPANADTCEFTRYVSPASLYALTPVTEATARRASELFRPRPVTEWELASIERAPPKQLPTGGTADEEPPYCQECGNIVERLSVSASGDEMCPKCAEKRNRQEEEDADGDIGTGGDDEGDGSEREF